MQSSNQGFPKFKRFSFRHKPPQRQGYSGGGVGQYQQYNDLNLQPGNINDTYPLPQGGGDGNHESFEQPWSTGLQPPDLPPDNSSPSTTAGGPPVYGNTGNTPISGGGVPLELINNLGYNPSYPYGGSGSGVPTIRAGGAIGGGIGGGIGSFFGPLGSIGGRQIGAPIGRMLARWWNNMQSNRGQPGQPQQPSGGSGGGGAPPSSYGGNEPYSPFGGLPLGFGEEDQHRNNQEGNFGAPNFEWHGFTGPEFHGDNITGGRGAPIVPGSGYLNNSESLPTLGGGRSDYGADLALHSGTFRNAIQNMGYSNLHDFQNQTGFRLTGSKLGSGAGVAGGLKPMTQSYAGGGVAKGDDLVNRMEGLDRELALSPEDMAQRYAELMAEGEERRREAMNEKRPERKMADISFAGGGVPRQVPPSMRVRGMGTDTVPAALTPGEVVLDKQQQSAVMPRPGMKRKLKPEQLAAIEVAMRKRKGGASARPPRPTI